MVGKGQKSVVATPPVASVPVHGPGTQWIGVPEGPACSLFNIPTELYRIHTLQFVYEVLPKISENLNIPRKLLALRTCAARCLLLYLSTVSQPTCVFISARVSEFWMFSLHRFHVCLLISKWRMFRSKEFALNFASSSIEPQLKPTEC